MTYQVPRFNFEGGKFNSAEYYDFVVNSRLVISDSTNLYYYKKELGFWKRLDESEGKTFLWSFFDKNIRGRIKVDIISSAVKRLLVDPTVIKNLEERRKKYMHMLNLNNGVLNVLSGELLPHDHKYGFDYFVDFNYLPDAEISEAKSFSSFCETSLDNCQSKINRLLQIIAYTISSVEGAEKCFLLVGPSNCGKSLVLDLVEKTVGLENSTNFPINRISDRFNLGELRKARLNANRELTTGKLKNLDVFKSIVSNERLVGEEKFGKPTSFYAHCKLLFAGNALPVLGETDGSNLAIFNRLCILKFSHGFADMEKDLKLAEKLYNERNIIFSVALKTLPELISNNFVFAEDEDSTALLNSYKEMQHSLPCFIQERCVIDEELKVHTKDIVASFRQYCKENCIPCCYTDNDISCYIAGLGGVTRSKFRLNGSNPLAGFINIGLRDMY